MKRCPVCDTQYGDEASFCSHDRTALVPVESASGAGGPSTDPLIGRIIEDRYRILDLVGRGGMGRVYLAEHLMMKRRCALKVMSRAMSLDPSAVARFTREATNAARITHPNVCAIYDSGSTDDGLIYLAMEYLEGHSLSDELLRRGPMSLGPATALITQAAAALAAAHALGIVHRDVKPDNIMLTAAPEGGGGAAGDVIKVVDFGIAKALGGEGGAPDSAAQLTKTGFIIGTPEYMSPEQLAGDPVDQRSDTYALALVFYRMVTGVLPFGGGTAQETLVKRLTEPPMPLRRARPEGDFPGAVQAVLDRALARWPQERFATVRAFAAELENAVSETIAVPAVAAPADATRVARPLKPTEVARRLGSAGRGETRRAGLWKGAGVVVALGAMGTLGWALWGGGVGGGGGGGGPQDRQTPVERSDSAGARSMDTVTPGADLGSAPVPAAPAGGRASVPSPRPAPAQMLGSDTAVVDQGASAGPDRALVQMPDLDSINDQLLALQDSMFDHPSRREDYRSRASRLFGRLDLPDSMRVRAALTVAAGYTADSSLTDAVDWYWRAHDLIPAAELQWRSQVKSHIDRLDAARR